jgi:hypothetical protein
MFFAVKIGFVDSESIDQLFYFAIDIGLKAGKITGV